MFNRLFWHNPFNREASVLYTIKQTGLPLREIISEMDRRGLVASGTTLTHPTVNRFLWKNGYIDYIKMRKKRYIENYRDFVDDSTWMQKIQQNKIP